MPEFCTFSKQLFRPLVCHLLSLLVFWIKSLSLPQLLVTQLTGCCVDSRSIFTWLQSNPTDKGPSLTRQPSISDANHKPGWLPNFSLTGSKSEIPMTSILACINKIHRIQESYLLFTVPKSVDSMGILKTSVFSAESFIDHDKMGNLSLKLIFRKYKVQASFMSGKRIWEGQKMIDHYRYLVPAEIPGRLLTTWYESSLQVLEIVDK